MTGETIADMSEGKTGEKIDKATVEESAGMTGTRISGTTGMQADRRRQDGTVKTTAGNPKSNRAPGSTTTVDRMGVKLDGMTGETIVGTGAGRTSPRSANTIEDTKRGATTGEAGLAQHLRRTRPPVV